MHIGYFNSKFIGCIKIRPQKSRDKHWVHIVPQKGGDGCGSSYVGRETSFRQTLELKCFTRGTIGKDQCSNVYVTTKIS